MISSGKKLRKNEVLRVIDGYALLIAPTISRKIVPGDTNDITNNRAW